MKLLFVRNCTIDRPMYIYIYLEPYLIHIDKVYYHLHLSLLTLSLSDELNNTMRSNFSHNYLIGHESHRSIAQRLRWSIIFEYTSIAVVRNVVTIVIAQFATFVQLLVIDTNWFFEHNPRNWLIERWCRQWAFVCTIVATFSNCINWIKNWISWDIDQTNTTEHIE